MLMRLIKWETIWKYNLELLQMAISMIKWLVSVFMTYQKVHKCRKMRAMSGDHDDVPRVTLVTGHHLCVHLDNIVTLTPAINYFPIQTLYG